MVLFESSKLNCSLRNKENGDVRNRHSSLDKEEMGLFVEAARLSMGLLQPSHLENSKAGNHKWTIPLLSIKNSVLSNRFLTVSGLSYFS